jgi:hypothetical protein
MENLLMGKDEIQAAIDKLEAMSERADAVARRLRPISPDTSGRRWQAKPKLEATPEDHVHAAFVDEQRKQYSEPIGCGELTGKEMRLSDGGRSKPHKTSATGYRAYDCDCDSADDPDGIWAHFDREFDDMVAGIR